MAIQASYARRNGVSPIHGTYRGWGSARRPMLGSMSDIAILRQPSAWYGPEHLQFSADPHWGSTSST